MTTHTDLEAQEEPSDAAIKLAEMILSDCGHSTAITTRLRDRVALRIDKYTAALESQPDAAQGVPTLPFAVFDEFGNGCEDRVRDHFAALLAATPKPQEQANEWKEAVLEQLVACSMDAPTDERPASILKRVIEMSVQMATDPAINAPQEQAAQVVADRWRWSGKDFNYAVCKYDGESWVPISSDAEAADMLTTTPQPAAKPAQAKQRSLTERESSVMTRALKKSGKVVAQAERVALKPLTDEQTLKVLTGLEPDNERWKGPREHQLAFAHAVITKFCEVNGLTAPAGGEVA